MKLSTYFLLNSSATRRGVTQGHFFLKHSTLGLNTKLFLTNCLNSLSDDLKSALQVHFPTEITSTLLVACFPKYQTWKTSALYIWGKLKKNNSSLRWRKNNLIHSFSEGTSITWNARSFVEDLNSIRLVDFLRW